MTRDPAATGHLPATVDPLVPAHPDTSFTQTRRLRHDGWTPERKRLFLECFAECGVVAEASLAAGMSARSAYVLRGRDPLFAAGWDAAAVLARPRLADEAYARAVNGVVERIYRGNVIVAERHRYDNRLTMSVLARLDARIDRAEEKAAPHLALAARWDDYLAALGEDRTEDGMALLARPASPSAPARAPAQIAGDRELRELHGGSAEDGAADNHLLWQTESGEWWTTYPPPPGFDGDEYGVYGDDDYRRELSADEQAAVDADAVDDRAAAEAQRDACFGFSPPPQPRAEIVADIETIPAQAIDAAYDRV